MSDDFYPSGPIMIKIDGAKIRRIRESKGLTQLYIATAVEVTTDTVSRWENKRYPSIKQENGLKLAEALEVSLEDILESEDTETEVAETTQKKRISGEEPSGLSHIPPETKKWLTISSPAKVALLFIVLSLCAILLYLFHKYDGNEPAPKVTARRIVPAHFVAGQPLPVFLYISNPGDQSISIILKEQLPPGTSATSTLPEISGNLKKDRSLKWLEKVSGTVVFSYIVTSDPAFQGQLLFDGTLKIATASDSESSVSGDTSSGAGFYHWADSNRDNRIGDEEILLIYDLVNLNTNSGIDMDQLEEIWLGDGYVWSPDEQRFSIIE